MRWTIAVLTIAVAITTAWAADPDELAQTKDMRLRTQLVADGQATCVIAIPDDAQYLALGAELAAGIEAALGVAPPVVKAADLTDEDLADTNVIALGIFCFNEVTERLYRRALVLCDYSWPDGEDSYVVRTVHNPWLSGTNVVFVGGKSVAGCELAVARFIELLADAEGGAVGPIIEVQGEGFPPPLIDEQIATYDAQIEAETSSRSMGGVAAKYCDDYFTRGDTGAAKLFLSAMRRLDALTEAEGAADDMRACRYIYLQFDRVEEGPAFTDEERLELTNLFFRLAKRLRYATATVNPSATPHGNNWNAMGASWAALYFSRYYPELEIGRTLLEKMDTYYEPNMANWRVNEDCPGYGNITLTGNYEWALHRPDERYIEGGGLRKMADLYMMLLNNLGQCCGFGDAGMIGSKYLVQAIPRAGWLYQDGRYLWMWDKLGGNPTRFWVPPEVLPRQRPDDLLGVKTMELAEWIYNRTNYESSRGFPIEGCFDKVTFRSGFGPDDQYMCIGGYCYGFHSHADANAIINYQDQGSVCLYDDGYMIPALTEHNTVTVLRDGWAGQTPELAQVVARADFAEVGMFRSRLAGYHGVDWDRCVIWPKGRYFLVVDELRAIESGDYNFQCIWRTLGAADLVGRRWTSEKDDRVFDLIACSDAALSQKESAGLSLNSKPFPLDKARRLVQAGGGTLGLGDTYQFANVFYTTAAADTRRVEAHRIGDSTTWIVDDEGELALAGINRSRPIAGVVVDAEMFHLAGGVLTAAGAVEVRTPGPRLSSNLPLNLQLNLTTGAARVGCGEPTEVVYSAPDGERTVELDTGSHDLTLRPMSKRRLADLTEKLHGDLAQLAAGEGAGQEDVARVGDGMRSLWEYTDFAIYPNFADGQGVKLAADRTPMTPEQAGYPVGTPPDLLRASGNVMFPDGETVRLDIDLGARRELRRVVVKSRQLVSFNGGCGVSGLRVLLSDEGFGDNMRPAAEREVTDDLQNALMDYALPLAEGAAGRYLRIEAIPYSPAHNVYIDSIRIEGSADRDEMLPGELHQNALVVADLDGDGRHEIITGGTDKLVHVIGPDGAALWRFATDSLVNDLTVADTTGGGDYIVVAGCEDKALYAMTEGGQSAWTVTPPPRTYARPGYRGVKPFQGRLTVAFAADLSGDVADEIIVGSANWRTYVYDCAGELLWDEVLWAHTPTCGAAFDLDGDGAREVVMGNSYTSTVIYSAGGEILGNGRGSGHSGPTCLACGDLDGNGVGEMVVGDRAGKLWFQEWKGRDLPNWSMGSDVTDVAVGDIDGDGRLETVAASRNYLVYLFDADGRPLWQTNLLDVCRDVEMADLSGDAALEIICACEDGTVKVLDAEGETLAWFRAGGWVRQVRACELDGDAATRELVATCDDGTVYGLQMTR